MAKEEAAYREACNMLRHYSNASLTVRLASVVQGVALISAWVYGAMQSPASEYLFLLPACGGVLTFFLYRFHLGYFSATEFFYRQAAEIEKRLFGKGARPMLGYDRFHLERYSGWKGKLLTLNAPFTLIGLLFLAAAILSIALL